ncbi:MAG: hypothetical protein RLZ47_315 [Bacteroidota bacterium]|jgi:hypothetical protein
MKFLIKLITLATILSGCNSNNEINNYNKEFKEVINKELGFPSNLINYNNHKYNSFLPKILITGASDCGNCIEKLNTWDDFLKQKPFSKVEVIFILMGRDNPEFRHYIDLNRYQNLTILIDSTATYMASNDIDYKYFQIPMLLDKKNRVRLVGDPMVDETILNYYNELLSDF